MFLSMIERMIKINSILVTINLIIILTLISAKIFNVQYSMADDLVIEEARFFIVKNSSLNNAYVI